MVQTTVAQENPPKQVSGGDMATSFDPTDTADSDRAGSAHEAEDLPEAVADGVAQFLGKPRLRGWIHVYSAVIAVIAGAALVAVSWSLDSTRAGIATLIYTCTIVAMFAVSGTTTGWTGRRRAPQVDEARRPLDDLPVHRGSYTPFALLALPSEKGWVLLWIVWAGALAGVALKMLWPSAPRWLGGVPLYILLGWVAAWFIGPIMQGAGVAAVVLLIVGGALYSIGGVLYALKWPNPWPTTFGHHEFFHACTAVAAICHYIAMWFAVFW